MYSIRFGTTEDLKALPVIEREAAQLFLHSPYPELADSALAVDSIEPGRDRVWVVVSDSKPVAFALMREHTNALHIQEIDVHPAHARKGLGGMLIREMAKIAKSEGKDWLTLTTMSDVLWNGPYYSRLGFEEIDRASASSDLRSILCEEEKAGIPMRHRICMRMKLT